MIEFRLFNIPIRVDTSFWITLGLIGFLNFDLRSSNGLMLIALFVIAGFLSILIHELGHALTIKHYKLPTNIVLHSFGGYATHPSGVLKRGQQFLVSLAGPLLQAATGLIVLYLVSPNLNLPEGNLFGFFLSIYASISLLWAILNCLPILPLDGGRMVQSILGTKKIKITIMISMITCVIMGLLGLTAGYYFGAIFMGFFFYQNFQAYRQLP